METPQPGRPEHWGHAHFGEVMLPKQFYKGEKDKEGERGVRLMAGEYVSIRRSPKDGEKEGKTQEALIINFNQNTGDASVRFDHESGNLAKKMVSRKDLEKLNPNGSRKEPSQ